MLVQRARDNLAYVVFCNLVGGQDELVFDGYSLVVDQDGELVARGPQFDEELIVCDIDPSTAQRVRLRDTRHRPAARGRRQVPTLAAGRGARRATAPPRSAARARSRWSPTRRSTPPSRSGLRDYVDKNGFERVLLGLSGGIDSALTACIAVDALGRRARRLRRHALPPLLRGNPAGRPAPRGQPRCRALRAVARAGDAGLRRGARRGVRGHGAGPRRGEHPGAHPRQPADGAVEQVRLAGADDRQQERVLGRLHDPLRRHGGRLRAS